MLLRTKLALYNIKKDEFQEISLNITTGVVSIVIEKRNPGYGYNIFNSVASDRYKYDLVKPKDIETAEQVIDMISIALNDYKAELDLRPFDKLCEEDKNVDQK